jgi:hypothetical protein
LSGDRLKKAPEARSRGRSKFSKYDKAVRRLGGCD